MKKRRKKPVLHPKHLFIALSILCVLLTVLSFKYSEHFSGVKSSVGNVMSPMQNGINSVGTWISNRFDLLKSKENYWKKTRS